MLNKKIILGFISIAVLSLSVGCQTGDKYTNGIHTGTAQGYGGPVQIQVSVKEGSIKEIKALKHNETPGVSDPAFETVIDSIIEKQSTEVDSVSGASRTSEAIKKATEDALNNSRK